MIKKYSKLDTFDPITRFRLINAFIFGIGFHLILPVLLDLRGELLTAAVITFILIMTTLSVKTNNYLVENLTLSEIYKVGLVSHLFFFGTAFMYFYDKLLFVYLDSFFAIIEMAIFSAYSIKLTNYLSDNYPEKMSEFQVFRNSIIADATLIGLAIVWLTSTFNGNDLSIIVFLVFNFGFTIWMMYHWNFIRDILGKNKTNSV